MNSVYIVMQSGADGMLPVSVHSTLGHAEAAITTLDQYNNRFTYSIQQYVIEGPKICCEQRWNLSDT